MDFQPQMKYILPTGVPMPFFMAYPDYPCFGKREKDKEDPCQDFEYLRRTYPAAVAKWQKRVEEILDKMDYEGSMIYDEFPDRLSLQDLGDAVARVLAAMEGEAAGKGQGADESGDGREDDGTRGKSVTSLENAWLQGLAQVLTCNEIYRRRQKRKQETNGRT